MIVTISTCKLKASDDSEEVDLDDEQPHRARIHHICDFSESSGSAAQRAPSLNHQDGLRLLLSKAET